MKLVVKKEEISNYRLWVHYGTIAVLSLVLTFQIYHNWNRPTVEEIATLQNKNEGLAVEIDSLKEGLKLKERTFAELQRIYSADSALLAQANANAAYYKRLYLSINKKHESINTSDLSTDSLQQLWDRLTR